MNPRTVSVQWSEGAPPEALIEAFGEAALTVAVLEALLADPQLKEKAADVLRASAEESTAKETG